MKNKKSLMSMILVLVFMFTVVMSTAVFAGTNDDKGTGKGSDKETVEKNQGNGNSELKKAETTKEDSDTADGEETKAVKEKDQIKEQEKDKEKDQLMEQKKELKKLLVQARESGDTAAAQELLAKLVENKEQLKLMVRNAYTEEEINQLGLVAQGIEAEDPALEVLPVETIIAKGKNLKLDLPPVIKEGKVLVPVRAFSQAYGAEVQYNAETKTITILKDGVKIEFVVGSSTVYVDGVATEIELPVKSINGRTVMPVGFLAEKLGLKVEVDEEDGTVEIDEEVETEDTVSE